MRHTFLLTIAILISFTNAFAQQVSRIAFGSCINQNDPQNIWYRVIQQKPDVFIFCGDNMYGDTKDTNVLRQKYNLLGSKPGYIKLKQNARRVLAVWDDHDYGKNDGGKEYPLKEESKKVFLEFFEEPTNSERWTHPGIYHSEYFGEEGSRLQVILLDTRTFRDKLLRVRADLACKGPYAKAINKRKTFLGKQQWEWLEQELQKPADMRLIVSSTQFLVDFNGWEAWINMPHERERMLQLIEKTKANGVFFISGDVHYAELSKLQRNGMYPIYDLTSSGMTHGHSCDGGNVNRVENIYMKANFGMLHLNWPDKKLTFEIRDEKGDVQITHSVDMETLRFK